MIIPQDRGGDWRLDKFVEYQHNVPPVQYEIFKGYATERNLSEDDQVYLSWLMCVTYQEITSLLILEEIPLGDKLGERFDSWYKTNKERVIIGSSKKHMKMQERLEQTIYSFEEIFGNNPAKTLYSMLNGITDPLKRTEETKKIARNIKHIGRFAADYFVETIHLLQKQNLNNFNFGEEMTIDYADGSNLTSALLNINYLDDLADKYDRGDMSREELRALEPLLDETLAKIDKRIQETYNHKVETTFFVTKLCSFRNLFKNSRYGGFHHDRELGFIMRYLETYPEKTELMNYILKIRKERFKHSLLGELNGWFDVRKERKRIWTEHGFTGVETESNDVIFDVKKAKKSEITCDIKDW